LELITNNKKSDMAIHTNELKMPNSNGGGEKNSEVVAYLFMEN